MNEIETILELACDLVATGTMPKDAIHAATIAHFDPEQTGHYPDRAYDVALELRQAIVTHGGANSDDGVDVEPEEFGQRLRRTLDWVRNVSSS